MIRGLVILLLMAGCSGPVFQDPQALASMTLAWHMGAEPDTLNPITSTDVYSSRVNSFVSDTLIERDNKTLEWRPKMAERWEISPDHLQFTFHLREGIRWHDGHPFTVEDILYSFDRIMDPQVASPHLRVYYQEIARLEKIDDRTVRFTYRRPYFMALEFCGTIPLVPKHLYDDRSNFNSHPLNRSPVGLGPYRFVSWKTGKHIVIERNEDYWGKAIGRMPEIRKIRFEFVTDDTIALQVLKKGELDFTGLRPIQWVRQTGSEKFNRRFSKIQFYTPSYSYIGWNARKPFFKDRRVRRAMTMLVNRKEILEKLNFGLGELVTGPFYFQSKDYDGAIDPIPYDPTAALKLLSQAGWRDPDGDGLLDRGGIPFQFQFLISSGSRFAERLGDILKEDLRKVGIAMEIRKVEWALFTQYLDQRNFDAVVLGWSLGLEQDPYQLWHSSQDARGSNIVGFSLPEADRLIEEGRMEFDRERRAGLYRHLHRIVHHEQPYTFLYTSPNLVALHRRFENVEVYPGGVDPLEWRVSKVYGDL